MTEKLRVGVVGASWYSDLRHLPALKSHPHAETVAYVTLFATVRKKWPGNTMFPSSPVTIEK